MYNNLNCVSITLKNYPEKKLQKIKWLDNKVKVLYTLFSSQFSNFDNQNKRFIQEVHHYEQTMSEGDGSNIKSWINEIKSSLIKQGFNNKIVAHIFALVKLAAASNIGMSHYDVQLVGGLKLLQGNIIEMDTGEGKTLTATLPASAVALAGIPVHIITVNDYLAERDAILMQPIYNHLGLTVAFVIEGMSKKERKLAYAADITYCTNKEIAFDFLKDRITLGNKPDSFQDQLNKFVYPPDKQPEMMLRGLCYAIVDEADSILIDEARTPLVISKELEITEEYDIYGQAVDIAKELVCDEDYSIDTKERSINLTQKGLEKLENLDTPYTEIWKNLVWRNHLLNQALTALYLFHKDEHYIIQDNKVLIVDMFTGRIMSDRSWERGLHQCIEYKEACEYSKRKETIAKTSYQKYFSRYLHLSGMTGTAREIASEIQFVYNINVIKVPPCHPVQRTRLSNQVFETMEQKWKAVIIRIEEIHQQGRPVLVGTASVAMSEYVGELLKNVKLSHVILNARQDREEAEIIAKAGQLNSITVATNMAGRGTDIVLGDGVHDIGGLHVIATEQHESARIDRQLFGRSGRQGNLGSCELIISLEDDIVKNHCSPFLLWLSRFCLHNKLPLSTELSNIVVHLAQRSAERYYSMVRKSVLKLDEKLDSSLAFSGNKE